MQPESTEIRTPVKPFDLQAALAGEKLVTRDGREALDFHHFKSDKSINPCAAIIGGQVYWFALNGRSDSKGEELDADLFMAPRKRTVYVNVYDHAGDVGGEGPKGTKAYAFDEEAGAISNSKHNSWGLLAIAFPVVIEE